MMPGLPMYAKIRDELKNKILSGELVYGVKVPSEAELCELYHVSRISAKRALVELENDGYVIRKVGKGTFVSYAPITHTIGGYYGLTEEIRRLGSVPSSRLLRFETLCVKDCSFDAIGLHRFIGLDGEDLVYHILCQRLRDGEIIALDNTFIPVKYCPGLEQADLADDDVLYRLLAQKFGFKEIRAWERYFARSVNDEEAKYLEATARSPAFKVLRVTSSQGKNILYNWRVYRGEIIHLSAELGPVRLD